VQLNVDLFLKNTSVGKLAMFLQVDNVDENEYLTKKKNLKKIVVDKDFEQGLFFFIFFYYYYYFL
jgi:hypothetical protein